jgi:CheY-like chemotaxis protein
MALASGKRILIVEDEPAAQDFLATTMGDAGFDVEIAVDGVEAIEKIKARKPDLMTLGMVMPRHSGITLMRKLNRNEEWADIPILVILSHPQDESNGKGAKEFEAFKAEHQPEYVLEKSVTPTNLVRTIGEILKKGEG